MRSWRDAILQNFVSHVNQLTLVADPDDLLTEELLAIELRHRGFDLIEFNDPVAFRYVYETRYRSIWDHGGHTDLMVIVRVQDSELGHLPYDLLKRGHTLAFGLGALFPHLSYPVIERLDHKYLDAIFEAQHKYAPDRMGENASKDFILRHVFGIAAELINTDVDLLRCLLRCHYNRLDIPDELCLRLIQVLSQQSTFQQWPLSQLVTDGEVFFAFLQERWPVYLNTLRANSPPQSPSLSEREGAGGEFAPAALSTQDQIKEHAMTYNLTYPGPELLPFGHQDLGVYLDNLFLENRLAPVDIDIVPPEDAPWVKTGVTTDRHDSQILRTTRLLTTLKDSLPNQDSRYSDWLSYALKWAELSAIMHTCGTALRDDPFENLSTEINTIFSAWLRTHYAGLVNLPPVTPAMVHQVTRCLARELEDSRDGRIALIVVDGLALDQWGTIRQILAKQDHSLVIRESATFAWIPTLTSVSRQAIFAGKPPIYFSTTIGSTDKEPDLWRQFWEGIGLSRFAIAYKKGLGDGKIDDILEETLHPGHTRAIGLVVDKVDKIMHGMQLGAAGMHNQIQQWCHGGFLVSLIRYLLNHNYQVWLTSDHGNIECTGQGRPFEGVIAETRGERVRVYPTSELLASVVKKYDFGHPWPPIGLPNDYYPLVAGGRSAFVKKGETIVAHGGASLEEVIVPFVKFERRK